MDIFFKEQLPPDIAALVDRIESVANREILIEVDSRPASPTSPNPDSLIARISPTEATILLRSKEVFPPHDVLHELLHIERMWLEQIPQLVPLSDPDGNRSRLAGLVENSLEHLVIVPREADYGFDPHPYWNKTSQRNWDAYPWPRMKDPGARRIACLLGSLSASFLVNDQDVKGYVGECLRKEGLIEEAQKFSSRVSEKLSSKPSAVSTVLRFLKVSRGNFTMLRLNAIDGTHEEVAIPEH